MARAPGATTYNRDDCPVRAVQGCLAMPKQRSGQPGTRSRSLIRRFFANPATGELVIAQPPNARLLVFLVASVGRLFLDSGRVGRAVSIVATISLSIWAILEVVRGDSPFRRVLGGVVLAAVMVGLVRR